MDCIRTLLIIFSLILCTEQIDIELRRFYRIENADGTILTVGGEPVENVKIITQEPTINIRDKNRQTFWIGSRVGIDQSIYEISPSVQNGAISLVLEENTSTHLLFQQIRHFRNTQWWRILHIGNGYWQVLNDNTNLCLVSKGNGNQVGTEVCNASLKNQTWSFNIERTGETFP